MIMDHLTEMLGRMLEEAYQEGHILGYGRIDDEPGTFGVETDDGEFFVAVQVA
jgi:hypothetical protein